jgi:5-methylcytosine-specific restriction endonuclease McrBC GTP-binding regulatory subunit McrB
MNRMVITQYIHRPNSTELGQGNTHETYLLVKRDTDLSDLFPASVNVEVKDAHGKIYTLKSAVGTEFRINQMGPIYRDYNVKPGDEIIFTHIKTDTSSELTINVRTYNRAVILKSNKGAEIANIERLPNLDVAGTSIPIKFQGKAANVTIKFLGLENKRSDSPEKTKFYDVRINGVELPKCNQNESFYLTLQGGESELALMPKSEYNRVVLSDEIDANNKAIMPPKREGAKNLQRIFYGAPGTGKSHTIKEETKGKKTIRTTFHPDTDYASFVGAYKPTMKKVDVQVVPVVLNNGASFEQNRGTLSEERISYEFVMQSFLQAYVAAWRNQEQENPQPVYLIIEEINRGNCAQIFGDIFQLLDRNDYGFSDYPINADQDLQSHLCKELSSINVLRESYINSLFDGEGAIVERIKSGEVLVLPDNLFIWATMNTSDQSLFPIDSAFKRRWNWEYVPIEYDKKNWTFVIGSHRYSWGEFLKVMNPQIYDLTDSSDKQMGYFFAKPDKKSDEALSENDTISEDVFLNKVLFYIWTDVLKDFDAGREPFLKTGTKKAYEFSEFFDNKDYLQEFISKLNLTEIDTSNSPENELVEESNESPTEQLNEGKYELDGKPCGGICELVRSIVEVLARKLTFEKLHEDFKFKTLNGKFGIEKGTASEQNEPGKKQRWCKVDYTSVDGIVFCLSNDWHDNDYAKIASIVKKYREYFPKGITKK